MNMIDEIKSRDRSAGCNNRKFRASMRCLIEQNDDCKVAKKLKLLDRDYPDDYEFRLEVEQMVGTLNVPDLVKDNLQLNERLNLALEDLRGDCRFCAVMPGDGECHHKPTPKCEWWKWDGFRRLNQRGERG